MWFEIEKFTDTNDSFFQHGLESAQLESRVTVDDLRNWFPELPEAQDIVEVYWIEPPFSFAVITQNGTEKEYQAIEVEEQDNDITDFVIESIGYELDGLEVEYANLFDVCSSMLEMIEDKELKLSNYPDLYHAVRKSSGFMRIYPYNQDRLVQDISYNGSEPVFIYHRDHENIRSKLSMPEKQVDDFLEQLFKNFGYSDHRETVVDKSLTKDARIQVTFGSSDSVAKTTFTIRMYNLSTFTPVDLYETGTCDLKLLSYLWLAVENRMNVLVSGGTASGKTSTLEALAFFTPKHERVISVERNRELSIPNENWTPGTTRDSASNEENEIGAYDLLRAALRQRPDFILFDEVSGQEAESIFQAMSTGHTGICTIHAETVSSAIGRLTNPPINVPKKLLTSLDIICVQTPVEVHDDQQQSKTVRRMKETREIVGLRDNQQFENRRPFQWDSETDTFIESIEDSAVIKRIRTLTDMSQEEILAELEDRSLIIESMADQEIRQASSVKEIINKYQSDPDLVTELARAGELKKLISNGNTN